MREEIELAALRFGSGAPKLCVPLVADTLSHLQQEMTAAEQLPADLYEWRIDAFTDDVPRGLELLRRSAGRPLLCTLRTTRDGGAADCTTEEYATALSGLIDHGGFALLDIELSAGEDCVRELIEKARQHGIGTVVSHHDFTKTPSEDEMVSLLLQMKQLGADLPKLAIMPKNEENVLSLLSATLCASRQVGPVITMAMGQLGMVTRAAGGVFGSCLTFGAGAAASAPGQLPADRLREMLNQFYPTPERGEADEKRD